MTSQKAGTLSRVMCRSKLCLRENKCACVRPSTSVAQRPPFLQRRRRGREQARLLSRHRRRHRVTQRVRHAAVLHAETHGQHATGTAAALALNLAGAAAALATATIAAPATTLATAAPARHRAGRHPQRLCGLKLAPRPSRTRT
eukprot:scaffold98864_cov59-Phaeocystis_antarctica.AAC.4